MTAVSPSPLPHPSRHLQLLPINRNPTPPTSEPPTPHLPPEPEPPSFTHLQVDTNDRPFSPSSSAHDPPHLESDSDEERTLQHHSSSHHSAHTPSEEKSTNLPPRPLHTRPHRLPDLLHSRTASPRNAPPHSYPPPLMPPSSPPSQSNLCLPLSPPNRHPPKATHPSVLRLREEAGPSKDPNAYPGSVDPSPAFTYARGHRVSPAHSPTSSRRQSSKRTVHTRTSSMEAVGELGVRVARVLEVPLEGEGSPSQKAGASPAVKRGWLRHGLAVLWGWCRTLWVCALYYVKSCFPFYPNPPYSLASVHSRHVSLSAVAPAPNEVSPFTALEGPAPHSTAAILTASLGLTDELDSHAMFDEAQREAVMQSTYLQGNRLMHCYILCESVLSFIIAVQLGEYVQTAVVVGPLLLITHTLVRVWPYHRLTRWIMGLISQGLIVMNVDHSGGIAEMQYGVFVTFTVLIIYQDWTCLWPAFSFVLLDYLVQLAMALNGDNTGFFDNPALDTNAVPIATHIIMLFFQVCLCSLWCHLERGRTLRDAVQRVQLVEERKQAQKASAAKSDFLSTMSHEIRTPMNGIIGMCELLLDTTMSAEQQEYAETIRVSGQSLLSIINDILDFGKVEANKLTLEHIPMNLHRVCEVVCDLMASNAADKGLLFVMRYSPTAPRYIIADPGRIRQIMLNLIGNAMKFTSQGFVILNVDVVDDTHKRQHSAHDGANGQSDGQLALDPFDPLALPGLSDLLDVAPPEPDTPVSETTAAIHRYVHRHINDAVRSDIVTATAHGPPAPMFASGGGATGGGPAPVPLFSKTGSKSGEVLLLPTPALSRGVSVAGAGVGKTPGTPGLKLRISCVDSGIGLSAEQVRHVFDPFTQADSSTSRKYGGSGLGLAISRRLCHLMGGELSVHSRLHDGSTFSFTLPLTLDPDAIEQHAKLMHAVERARASTRPGEPQAASGGFTRSARTLPLTNRPAPVGVVPNVELLADCRVLVVDGQQLTRCVLVETLTYHGACATVCPDPSGDLEQGLTPSDFYLSSALNEWARCHLTPAAFYHAVLIDADGIGMSVDVWRRFYEAVEFEQERRRRSMEQEVASHGTSFVVLVTARQKRRYEEAVNGARVLYLLKPFREPALIRVLTTPHSMHNTHQYDHPSRTSYPSVLNSTTHVQQPSQTVHSTPIHAAGRVQPLLPNPLPVNRRPSLASLPSPTPPEDTSWYTAGEDDGDGGDGGGEAIDRVRLTHLSPFGVGSQSPIVAFRRASLGMQPVGGGASPQAPINVPTDHGSPVLRAEGAQGGRRLLKTSSSHSDRRSQSSGSYSPPPSGGLSPATPMFSPDGPTLGTPQGGGEGVVVFPSSARPLGLEGSRLPGGVQAILALESGPHSRSNSGFRSRGVSAAGGVGIAVVGGGESLSSSRSSSDHGGPGDPSSDSPSSQPLQPTARPRGALPSLMINTTGSGSPSRVPQGKPQVRPAAPRPPTILTVPVASVSAPVGPAVITLGMLPPPGVLQAAVSGEGPGPSTPGTAAPPKSPATRAGPNLGRRILLVEDTALNVKVATRMLEKMGCAVVVAVNGLEAVERVRAERATIDLVFMDINMPVMDGNEATRRIREEEVEGGYGRMPIVAMTADCMPEVEERCAAVGMDEVIYKPISTKKIEQCIKKHTRRRG